MRIDAEWYISADEHSVIDEVRRLVNQGVDYPMAVVRAAISLTPPQYLPATRVVLAAYTAWRRLHSHTDKKAVTEISIFTFSQCFKMNFSLAHLFCFYGIYLALHDLGICVPLLQRRLEEYRLTDRIETPEDLERHLTQCFPSDVLQSRSLRRLTNR